MDARIVRVDGVPKNVPAAVGSRAPWVENSMNNPPPGRTAIIQLRRLLRRLDRAHTGDDQACTACGLQQLAMQLVDEIETESERLAHDDLRPGAASIMLAVEGMVAVILALGVREADEQGRVLQALLDYVGSITLDQLAQIEIASGGNIPLSPEKPRRGPLH